MKDYQIKKTKEFREIEVFSLFFISFAGNFILADKFFGRIKVKQQRIKIRYAYLNEFDYQIYWTKWEKSWKTIK